MNVKRSSKPDCDVVVIGGGLAGVACAYLLHGQGLAVTVLEAADRAGGRIRSMTNAPGAPGATYAADLGPAWVWPEYQPVIADWLERLGVETFEQFEDGDAILDLDPGMPVRRGFLPGQHGIRRLRGGPQALIDKLFAGLPDGTVRTGCPVVVVEVDEDNILVTTAGPGAATLRARRAVVAAPLRICAQTVIWPTEVDASVLAQMRATPTWMATQAKAVALYDRPFWRDGGLSGRVASHIGPLVEVHDHTQPDGGQAALFGFVGWPHAARAASPERLHGEIIDQLARCFGDEARTCRALHVEDWAANTTICSDLDLATPPSHPVVTSDVLRKAHCGGRLFFCSAETAVQSPGLIEGALAAAASTAHQLQPASATTGSPL